MEKEELKKIEKKNLEKIFDKRNRKEEKIKDEEKNLELKKKEEKKVNTRRRIRKT